MLISMIVAMDRNRVIGIDNRLPWRLPSDLKRFKLITMGKPLIMGRRTYESIGRPLPGRQNIVITRDRNFDAPGCIVVHSVDAALMAAADADEVMIIGGGRIYELLLPRAGRLYLTLLDTEVDGDTYFPQIDPLNWTEISRITVPSNEGREYAVDFVLLERVSGRQ